MRLHARRRRLPLAFPHLGRPPRLSQRRLLLLLLPEQLRLVQLGLAKQPLLLLLLELLAARGLELRGRCGRRLLLPALLVVVSQLVLVHHVRPVRLRLLLLSLLFLLLPLGPVLLLVLLLLGVLPPLLLGRPRLPGAPLLGQPLLLLLLAPRLALVAVPLHEAAVVGGGDEEPHLLHGPGHGLVPLL